MGKHPDENEMNIICLMVIWPIIDITCSLLLVMPLLKEPKLLVANDVQCEMHSESV